MPLPLDEPDIPREDGTPPLAEQCAKEGWGFDWFDFGKGDDGSRTFFNPAIIERPDGYWLLTRVSENNDAHLWGLNSIVAFQLDDEGKVPKVGHRLTFTDSAWNEQHEDPRAAYFPTLNQTVICCTNFVWYGYSSEPAWTGALQVCAFFAENWECKIKHRPPIGGNPKELGVVPKKDYEKSWMPFFHNGKLHIFYSANPWRIFEFGETWEQFKGHQVKDGLTWRHGLIRNGTPPILVGKEYVSFFHSSLPWKGHYRRYFMGAMTFEAKPPFRPLRITPEPLLAGSQNDPWELRKPPCVFPCGAVLKGDRFIISAGVNDAKACRIEIPVESLNKKLTKITDTVTPIFPVDGLSEAERLKQRRRDSMAKARAALAEKRALVKERKLTRQSK